MNQQSSILCGLYCFDLASLTPYREYVYFCLTFILKANLLAIFLSII